jgi:hypothetical protein
LGLIKKNALKVPLWVKMSPQTGKIQDHLNDTSQINTGLIPNIKEPQCVAGSGFGLESGFHALLLKMIWSAKMANLEAGLPSIYCWRIEATRGDGGWGGLDGGERGVFLGDMISAFSLLNTGQCLPPEVGCP